MDSTRNVVPPKTGSTFNGLPAIDFIDEEVTNLSKPFSLTIIGTFAHGIPKIYEVTKML